MARCNRIFKEEYINPYVLAKRTIHFAQEQLCLTKWNSLSQNEVVPQNMQYIIRTDGSFESADQLAGIGWTINKNEELVNAGASTVRASSIIHAELIAIQAGIQEVEKSNLSNFIFYSDSIDICNIIQNKSAGLTEYIEDLNNCKEILGSHNGVIIWTSRSYISASDQLANHARKLAVSNYWDSNFPTWSLELNDDDYCNSYK